MNMAIVSALTPNPKAVTTAITLPEIIVEFIIHEVWVIDIQHFQSIVRLTDS